MSLQDKGRIPLEREDLMVSVTKEHRSFTHFFKTKGAIPRELSVEFDLMRYKSGRISELEAGLNITFAVPRHVDYLIVYT